MAFSNSLLLFAQVLDCYVQTECKVNFHLTNIQCSSCTYISCECVCMSLCVDSSASDWSQNLPGTPFLSRFPPDSLLFIVSIHIESQSVALRRKFSSSLNIFSSWGCVFASMQSHPEQKLPLKLTLRWVWTLLCLRGCSLVCVLIHYSAGIYLLHC